MEKRDSHVHKTIEERQTYQRYIEIQHYEPTVDDRVEFAQTAESGEELSEPTAKQKRKINLAQRLGNHLSENWPFWLVGLLIAIIGFYTINARINFAEIRIILGTFGKTMERIENKVDENNKAINEQSKIIHENKIRIEYLQPK